MRTSRIAWGKSIAADPSAAIEWELGSRVMNDMEVENLRATALGAVTTRLNRAQPVWVGTPGDQYFEHLVELHLEPNNLYFVYDVLDDGTLLAARVHPADKRRSREYMIAPARVKDSTPWEQLDELTQEACDES